MNFPTAQQYWINLAIALLTRPLTPSRNGPTREIVGWSGTIVNPADCWAGGLRGASKGYAAAELLWYLRGERDIEMLSAYAPSYSRFCNPHPLRPDTPTAMGAYGWRWKHNPGVEEKGGGKNSLELAVELLRRNPDDRRAFVSMWDSGDVVEALRGEWKDIPCTIGIQFLSRDGYLHAVATMRSNDLWLGGIYDIWCFCQLQRLVAAALDLKLGTYTHTVGSMHFYEKNERAVREAIKNYDEVRSEGPPIPRWLQPEPTRGEAVGLIQGVYSDFIGAEIAMRNGGEYRPNLRAWSSDLLDAMKLHLHGGK